MGFTWQWDYMFEVLPRLLGATGNTLLAAIGGYAIAVVIGLVFALGQRTPFWLVNRIVRECVEFIRSTPLLLQIFFVFFVGPQFGIFLSPWVAGLLAIGVHYGSYLSEVYRAGLESVPKGQWEAAKALNLSTWRTYTRIIIPQSLPPSVPAMGNYPVSVFKATPMLSAIGVPELVLRATEVGSEVYRFLEPFTLVGIIFLVISLVAAAGVRKFEQKVRRAMGLSQ